MNMEGQDQGFPKPNDPTASGTGQTTPDDHLNHLLAAGIEEPWYRTFFQNLKDAIAPPKLPPLEVTAKPVAVKDIWGDYRYGKQAAVSSTLIHVGIVALLFTLATNKQVQQAVKHTVSLVAPIDTAPLMPDLAPKKVQAGGGGGGGDRSPLPASKGQAPKMSMRQFTPPLAVRNNPNPKLEIE
ncbi:MAG TPA: hypothetical protein VN428_17440, partial [Bryobacteraceae bacterium]|nr:hypothetical protein [Bryobacteraceae bacterium]